MYLRFAVDVEDLLLGATVDGDVVPLPIHDVVYAQAQIKKPLPGFITPQVERYTVNNDIIFSQ